MVIEIFENFHPFFGRYIGLRRDRTTTAAYAIRVSDEVRVLGDMLTLNDYPATIALAEDGARITPICDDLPAYVAPFTTIGNEPAPSFACTPRNRTPRRHVGPSARSIAFN